MQSLHRTCSNLKLAYSLKEIVETRTWDLIIYIHLLLPQKTILWVQHYHQNIYAEQWLYKVTDVARFNKWVLIIFWYVGKVMNERILNKALLSSFIFKDDTTWQEILHEKINKRLLVVPPLPGSTYKARPLIKNHHCDLKCLLPFATLPPTLEVSLVSKQSIPLLMLSS